MGIGIKYAQSLNSFAQSYDAAGNITGLTENGTLSTSYGYDQLNRLTSENISGYGNISYSYDATGNLDDQMNASILITSTSLDDQDYAWTPIINP